MNVQRPLLFVVEDDRSFRETVVLEFEERGYDIIAAGSAEELDLALTRLGPEHHPPRRAFAIIDLRLGLDDGIDVVRRLTAVLPECRAVVLTGYASLATAVRAMKDGAVNYLAKPASIERIERALWTDDPDPKEVAAPDGGESLARHEREYIEYVLLQCGGNITQAARWLGLHRQSLQRMLRKYSPN